MIGSMYLTLRDTSALKWLVDEAMERNLSQTNLPLSELCVFVFLGLCLEERCVRQDPARVATTAGHVRRRGESDLKWDPGLGVRG